MRFSEAFGLGKSQFELDFVDVNLDGDSALFIDPFALSQRVEPWAVDSHDILTGFFETVLARLRAGKRREAAELLSHLKEPNETHLGLSRGASQGAGIGRLQASKLIDALVKSSAFKSGSLAHLEECELWVDSISHDKISDLATNVLRSRLAEYTLEQCRLHGVPTRPVALSAFYVPEDGLWRSDYFEMPVHNSQPVLLVPKVIVRWKPAYQAANYYNIDVLDFLQAEHGSAGADLIQSFRRARRRKITKKELAGLYPCSKDFLAEFSEKHPEVLESYRERLKDLVSSPEPDWTLGDESEVASALMRALKSIPAGKADAGRYHSLMVGIVQMIFYPHIVNPKKETPIHGGRKRIDITAENAARSGFLQRLSAHGGLPCTYLFFEAKNYVTDIGNPELDQMIGRFSDKNGKLGFILCRSFDDRKLFTQRCRDTFLDGHGVIVTLDDDIVLKCLTHIESGERYMLDGVFSALVEKVRLG